MDDKIYESPDNGRTVSCRKIGSGHKKFVKLIKFKYALVLGAGGFIGNHLVDRLISEGYWVRAVDIKKYPDFCSSKADEYIQADLRDYEQCKKVIESHFDEIYQLAADMGGAGFIFTGENDFDIMHNSATINLNVAKIVSEFTNPIKIFYSSSACVYPSHNQSDNNNPICSEDSAYPANPDSEYGWEKLFSERMYFALSRNKNVSVRVARFHNIFGPYGTYKGGREKAPAALCRKVAESKDVDVIDVWGDGLQTRSFLYIDECLDGVRKFMMQDGFQGPLNIGSDEMVSINQLVKIISEIANKSISVNHISGPLGVRGRTSDNRLIRGMLNWSPSMPLRDGLKKTYDWILNNKWM